MLVRNSLDASAARLLRQSQQAEVAAEQGIDIRLLVEPEDVVTRTVGSRGEGQTGKSLAPV